MRKVLFIPILIFSVVYGCSVPKKAKLSSTDPKQVIKNLKVMRDNLITSNADLFARTSFERADKKLELAIKNVGFSSNKNVLDTLSEAKALFLHSRIIAKDKTNRFPNIIQARKNTINTGVNKNEKLKRSLGNIDRSLISKSNNFSKPLTPTDHFYFEKKYQNLEIEYIQSERLGIYKTKIREAERSKARKLAPHTLDSAKNAVFFAENLISKSPLDSSYYIDSVKLAKEKVKLLNQVMEKLKNEAKGSSEQTALKLVFLEHQLSEYSDEINTLKSSVLKSNSKMKKMSQEIVRKNH